jgi:hypothetical protein
MSDPEFKYAPWPTDFAYAFIEEMVPRVAFIPDGRRAVLFTVIGGRKVALVTKLDDLDRAVAELHADPATRLQVIDGGLTESPPRANLSAVANHADLGGL